MQVENFQFKTFTLLKKIKKIKKTTTTNNHKQNPKQKTCSERKTFCLHYQISA